MRLNFVSNCFRQSRSSGLVGVKQLSLNKLDDSTKADPLIQVVSVLQSDDASGKDDGELDGEVEADGDQNWPRLGRKEDDQEEEGRFHDDVVVSGVQPGLNPFRSFS